MYLSEELVWLLEETIILRESMTNLREDGTKTQTYTHSLRIDKLSSRRDGWQSNQVTSVTLIVMREETRGQIDDTLIMKSSSKKASK